MPITIETQGADPLQRQLRRGQQTAKRAFNDTAYLVAQNFARRARANVPIDTGALRESVRARRISNGGQFGYYPKSRRGPARPTTAQAVAIEYGTRYMRARAPVRTAIARNINIQQSFIVRRGNRWASNL